MPTITTAKRLRLSNNSDSGGFGLRHREEVRVNRHIFKSVYTILQLARPQINQMATVSMFFVKTDS